MKLLLYVNPRTARANRSRDHGSVDYIVCADLASEITARNLLPYAERFALDDDKIPVPDVHRLDCAAATDAAVLDTLGILRHQVMMAKEWARHAEALAGEHKLLVPRFVYDLWARYPSALYRELLGPQVEILIRLAEAEDTTLIRKSR